jgi:hypothetical protein
MLFRSSKAWLIPAGLLLHPLISSLPCLAADDARPACSSQNQGRMWPEAANHDPKLVSQFLRCGELLICVRGKWRYHWEAPSVRLDQLNRNAKTKPPKPPSCEAQSIASRDFE